MVEQPQPAELGPHPLQRAPADLVRFGNGAEVRNQARSGPFERKQQDQEAVLLVAIDQGTAVRPDQHYRPAGQSC